MNEQSKEPKRRNIWGRFSGRGRTVIDRWEDCKVLEVHGSVRSAGRRAHELNSWHNALRLCRAQKRERIQS